MLTTGTKKEIIATLLHQGRPDLVKLVTPREVKAEGKMVKAPPRKILEEMSMWHSSMGDPVYQAQSTWWANKPVPFDIAQAARNGLAKNIPDAKKGLYGWGKDEIKALESMVKAIDKVLKTATASTEVQAMGHYWSVDVNKGLEGWWQEMMHHVQVGWETIKWSNYQQGGSGAFWFRQISGQIKSNGENFTMSVMVSPTSGIKLETNCKIIDGYKKGQSKKLPTLKQTAQAYEVSSLVNAWLVSVFKDDLG
jgi:hypothetical protein